jgi:putative ABC transport system permease protein
MLKNYVKIAWRNLVNSRIYSFINISGLVLGLTIGILILLWVQDELSFDGFHSKAKSIYKLENMVGTGESTQIWQSTAAPIGMLAKKNIPDVKDFARASYNAYYSLYKYKTNVFNETNAFFTDPSLFSIFGFKLVKGNPAIPFPDINSVVITESTAKKYFGSEEPIGKMISADDKINFTVSGVIKDFPLNSTITGDMFFPMDLLAKNMYEEKEDGRNLDNDFIQYNYQTFLLVRPGADLSGVPAKLKRYHLAVKPDDGDITYLLQPLTKMHLYKSDGSDGGIETVRIFIIIALLILVIACINYVNLSTARSMLRAREVSLRKIVGAKRMQLFKQFITETVLMFFIAVVFALFFIYILMPYFNQVSGKELNINYTDWHIWQVILATFTATLLISSIYPALLLSSFNPIMAIKGKVSSRISNILFRKILVVTQFVFSVVLIGGTIIISQQLEYIRTKQLGYEKEHVISFPMQKMKDHFDAVKAELLHQPGVRDVTRASHTIVRIGGQTGDNNWDGKETGETMMVRPMTIDGNFIPFFNISLLQGKNFTGTIADSTHFILNETAVKTARIEYPIGKKFKLWKVEGTIIGVVKDFHIASMKNKIEPVIFYYHPIDMGRIYIKTTATDAPRAIASAEKVWKEYNADFPFTYAFLDDTFNNLYLKEQRTGVLFRFFAAIAIFISCLGLLGLAMYTSQVRTREIGVRKVLGASIPGIVKMLAKDFIILVIIAIVIATPISWYVMKIWLQDFVYRIDIHWWIFLISGILALIIALLTVSFQAVKAALANPVASLRNE